MDKQTILQGCTVDGTVVKLPPGALDRTLYMEVAKALGHIGGGKWNRKVEGFIFPVDPTDLLAQIAGGEKRNLKKEFQFFETPAELADKIISYAEINDGDLVCEPSVGRGALIKALWRAGKTNLIWAFEIDPISRQIFEKECESDHIVLRKNFLMCTSTSGRHRNSFDRVIANPPFTKNQDIDHIRKMYEVCAPGGRIVTMSSMSWYSGSQKKQVEFKQWLNGLDSDVEEIPAGTFKESGTTIASLLITINKD